MLFGGAESKAKKEYYTQCKLVNGTVHYVAFIPSKFAKQDNEIVITENGVKKSWTVKDVYSRVELSEVKNQQHNSGDIWTATSGKYPRGNK